jgi:Ca2+-binding RTX toxin-like protein
VRCALVPFGCSLALLFPGSALAGTAAVKDDHDPRSGELSQSASYTAAAGERNDLTIAARDSEVEFRDTAGITPGRLCSRPNPADLTRVICRSSAGDFNGFNGFAGASLGDRDDRARVTEGSATLDGGKGNDTLAGGPGYGTLMIGGPGNDDMTGGPGNDSFDEAGSHNGSDTMRGGAGEDDVDYSLRSADLHVSLDDKRDDGARGERDLVAADVEKVDAGSGDDTLIGNRFDNILQGATGSDSISGRAGDDLVDAGRNDAGGERPARSRDRVKAGPGDDVLFGAGRGTVLDGGSGHDDFIGSEGGDRIRARDGQSDSISCYRGRDSVNADGHDFVAGDRDTGRCERVRRRGAAVAVAVGEPFVNDPGPLSVNSPDGTTGFSVACPVDGPRICRGSVTATLEGFPLGTRTFRLRRGSSKDLSFTVPAGGRQQLLARSELRLRARVVSRDRRRHRRTVRDSFAVKVLRQAQ